MRPSCMRPLASLLSAAFLALVSLAGVVVGAQPASALSCVPPGIILKDTPQVFTGHVVEVDGDRVLVDVVENWRGGPVGERVWLHVSLMEWTAWNRTDGSTDGEQLKTLWAFAPTSKPGGALEVNACTAFGANSPQVRKFRPDDASPPVATPTSDGTDVPPSFDIDMGSTDGESADEGDIGGVAPAVVAGGVMSVVVVVFGIVVLRRRQKGPAE